jgi:hypothetical protein
MNAKSDAIKKLGDCPRVSLMSGFRVFGVLRVSLLVGDKSEQHSDGFEEAHGHLSEYLLKEKGLLLQPPLSR